MTTNIRLCYINIKLNIELTWNYKGGKRRIIMNNRFKAPIHTGFYPGGPGLIRPFTHSPIHFYMQNKPNLHNNSHKCLRKIGLHKYLYPALLVYTNNQSSIINNQWKGEPNSMTYAETKSKSEFIPTHRERAGKPNLKTYMPQGIKLMYLKVPKTLQILPTIFHIYLTA